MSVKKTFVWLLIAGGLFAFIFFYHRHVVPSAVVPGKVLPELRAEAVTSVQVRPSGPNQLQIRVDRTNGAWQLTQPLIYPAHTRRVNNLLAFLEDLKPAPYLPGTVLRAHTNADEEFGFAKPQATVVIQQGSYSPRLRVGALTTPGDQVYLQLEGDLGAYVVSADLLKFIPRSADDWRDNALLNVTNLVFDRLAVTNNSKGEVGRGLPASSSTFVVQRDPTNGVWRMIWPLDARANHAKIQEGLQKLQEIRIRQFVSDDPKVDAEPFGLAPPELELDFAKGTNVLASLQFGRSASNDVTRIYARRAGQPAIFAVDKDLLLNWCSFLNDFRDPHLLSLTDDVQSVEFTRGQNRSSVQRQADGTWRVIPGGYPGDIDSVRALVSGLTNLEIQKFVNDVANPADLPQYGLAPSFERLTLRGNCAAPAGATNAPALAELDFGFGTNAADQVFARRTDESFVYAISTNDFYRLPSASWQLRDRQLSRFGIGDVAGLTLRLAGKSFQMIHKGPLSWTLAAGSQGIINDAAVEETVRGVVETAALSWVARGKEQRATHGFVDDGYHVVLEFKNGSKLDLEFGGEAATGNRFAGVMLDGEFWIMEFPWIMYRDIDAYFPLKPAR